MTDQTRLELSRAIQECGDRYTALHFGQMPANLVTLSKKPAFQTE